jgi:AP-1 complex subunit gamma-1
LVISASDSDHLQVTDAEVVDLLESVLNTPYVNTISRQFVLTALTKVSGRPRTTEASRQRIVQVLEGFSQSPELETQQRAVEYTALFDSSLSELRTGVLEEMPPPEVKATVVGVGESSFLLT